jgi:hypothetical protein
VEERRLLTILLLLSVEDEEKELLESEDCEVASVVLARLETIDEGVEDSSVE